MSKERPVNLGSLIGPVTERLGQKRSRRETLLFRGTIVSLLVSLGSIVGAPIAVYKISGNEWSAFLAFSASLAVLATIPAAMIPIEKWAYRLSPDDRELYEKEIQKFRRELGGRPDIKGESSTLPKPPEPPSSPGASSLVPSPIKPAPGGLQAEAKEEFVSTAAK